MTKLYTLDQIRKALELFGVDMEYRGDDLIAHLAEKEPESHEARTLRYKLKTKSQELGKMGSRIYDLRCQLAEARSITNHGDRSFHRTMLQANREQAQRIKDQEALIYQLRQQLTEASVDWVPRSAFDKVNQDLEQANADLGNTVSVEH